MKRFVISLFGLAVLFVGCAQDQTEEINRLKAENAELRAAVGPPPSSLDALFPPEAESPILLMQMHGMAGAFMSMMVDAFEGDVENAQANYEQFAEAYKATSNLVPPEWKDKFVMEPVEALGTALQAGDPAVLMPAVEAVGQVCHHCHLQNMAKVQAKYEWPHFADLLVTDPVTNQEMPYANFMQMVEMSLMGTVSDLGQGQTDAARGHFADFNTRFQELKEACEFCHDTPRLYYVDDSSQERVDEIGTALKADSPDPQEILHMVEKVGMETCHKCHMVHIPATYLKYSWAEAH